MLKKRKRIDSLFYSPLVEHIWKGLPILSSSRSPCDSLLPDLVFQFSALKCTKQVSLSKDPVHLAAPYIEA